MSNMQFKKHSMLLKTVSAIVVFAFCFNVVLTDAWAALAASASSYPASSVIPLHHGSFDVDKFQIPEYLGTIQDLYKGKSDKVVIHVQDAHCNYAAQQRIADILDYLGEEWGISVVNLEGGGGSYDLTPLTSISNPDVRRRVSDFFVKEGLVNGVEYFAANNPSRVELWGVENPELYLKNLNAYKESLKHKEEVDRHLASLDRALVSLKKYIYSEALMELDKKYSGYKSEVVDFKDYATYLISKGKDNGVDVKSFTNIWLLHQSLDLENNINFSKANAERDQLIDRLQKILSKKELEEFVVKTVDFRGERLSTTTFYIYLIKKSGALPGGIEDLKELQKYIKYISIYGAVDRSLIDRETNALENKIKEALYENDGQRQLNLLSKNLALMKNFFGVTLSREDYEYYKDQKDALNVINYTSFMEQEAPLYGVDAKLSENIQELDQYRSEMRRFYEFSFKRDKAFLRNMKFGRLGSGGQDPVVRSAALVTGGFHSENLRELFKKKDISYISILPKFKNDDSYESPYFNLLSEGKSPFMKAVETRVSNLAMYSYFSENDVAVPSEQKNLFDYMLDIRAKLERGEEAILATEGGRDVIWSLNPEGEKVEGVLINGNPVYEFELNGDISGKRLEIVKREGYRSADLGEPINREISQTKKTPLLERFEIFRKLEELGARLSEGDSDLPSMAERIWGELDKPDGSILFRTEEGYEIVWRSKPFDGSEIAKGISVKGQQIYETRHPMIDSGNHPFRFHKKVWQEFKPLLKEIGEREAVYKLVKENGLMWTDYKGEPQEIDAMLEKSGFEEHIPAVWEAARKAINKANGDKKQGDEGYVETVEDVKKVIRFHEGLHSRFRSNFEEGKYKKLMENFYNDLNAVIRFNVDIRFGRKSYDEQPFFTALKKAYGIPHEIEKTISGKLGKETISDDLNWRLEEFLVLSIQEKELFGKDYGVLEGMISAANAEEKEFLGNKKTKEGIERVIKNTLESQLARELLEDLKRAEGAISEEEQAKQSRFERKFIRTLVISIGVGLLVIYLMVSSILKITRSGNMLLEEGKSPIEKPFRDSDEKLPEDLKALEDAIGRFNPDAGLEEWASDAREVGIHLMLPGRNFFPKQIGDWDILFSTKKPEDSKNTTTENVKCVLPGQYPRRTTVYIQAKNNREKEKRNDDTAGLEGPDAADELIPDGVRKDLEQMLLDEEDQGPDPEEGDFGQEDRDSIVSFREAHPKVTIENYGLLEIYHIPTIMGALEKAATGMELPASVIITLIYSEKGGKGVIVIKNLFTGKEIPVEVPDPLLGGDSLKEFEEALHQALEEATSEEEIEDDEGGIKSLASSEAYQMASGIPFFPFVSDTEEERQQEKRDDLDTKIKVTVVKLEELARQIPERSGNHTKLKRKIEKLSDDLVNAGSPTVDYLARLLGAILKKGHPVNTSKGKPKSPKFAYWLCRTLGQIAIGKECDQNRKKDILSLLRRMTRHSLMGSIGPFEASNIFNHITTIELQEPVISKFRFPKYIWNKFEKRLQQHDLDGIVSQYGLSWTTVEENGEITKHRIGEKVTPEKAEIIWTEAMNVLNLFDAKNVKSIYDVMAVVDYHEAIHALLKSGEYDYKKLVRMLRERIEGKFGTLSIDHDFITAFGEIYGEPHGEDYKGSDQSKLNWYLEEFLTLSIQEMVLFDDPYAVIKRIGTKWEGLIDVLNDVLSDPIARELIGTNIIHGQALYDNAKDLIPSMLEEMRQNIRTYAIEPDPSEDILNLGEKYLGQVDRKLKKDKGNGRHPVCARSYHSGKYLTNNVMKTFKRMSQAFYDDVTGITGERLVTRGVDYGHNPTRMVIRLLLPEKIESEVKRKKEITKIKNHIKKELLVKINKDGKRKHLSVTEKASMARDIINRKIKFIIVYAEETKYLNTATDLLLDLTMTEIDRYGSYDGYMNQKSATGEYIMQRPPERLVSRCLHLLRLSIDNFPDLVDGIVSESGTVDIKKVLDRIFHSAYLLRIRPINWSSVTVWKKNQDLILRSL